MQQMDALTTQIGERGKAKLIETSATKVQEGVPPPQPAAVAALPATTPPAPAPAPAAVVAPAPAAEAQPGTAFLDLLRRLDVLEYASALAEEEIRSEDDLRDLTMEELKELGFKLGSRKRVVKWGATG